MTGRLAAAPGKPGPTGRAWPARFDDRGRQASETNPDEHSGPLDEPFDADRETPIDVASLRQIGHSMMARAHGIAIDTNVAPGNRQ